LARILYPSLFSCQKIDTHSGERKCWGEAVLCLLVGVRERERESGMAWMLGKMRMEGHL
jgi:hypothetical protein